MKHLFCIGALLCLYLNGLAQPIPPDKKGLSIGDTLPDFLMNNINNYPLKKVRFSGFQKELTIIDFWASWCGACVASFTKMHGLQSKYARELQVLMVNASPGEDAQKMQAFFERRKTKTGKDFTLPYLLGDSLFVRLFPYRVIPHCVWIDKNRRVIAITESEEVNEANIAAVLEGREPALAFKNDALLFDDAKDELMAGIAAASEGLLYSSLITAAKPGMGQKLFWKSEDGILVTQLRIFNYSLLSLYRTAFRQAFDHANGRLEVEPGLEEFVLEDVAAERRTRYCYELQIPAMNREAALRFLVTDLERFFNITALPAKRWTSVFVLSAGKNMHAIISKNGPTQTDMDPESMAPFMNNVSLEALSAALAMVLKNTVINETGLLQNIDIRFPAAFFSFSPAQVIQFLQQQGLVLQQCQRMLPVARLQFTNTTLQLPKTN